MSNDTQESQLGSTRPRLTHPSILTQMQIERLKREDEEEHWISGEELYTEGSSDDDDDRRDALLIRNAESVIKSNYSGNPAIVCRSKLTTLVSGHHRSQIRHHQRVKLDETDYSATKTHKEEEKEELNAATSSDVATSDGTAGDHEETEDDREISWRPKRDDNKYGTIVSKLDNSTEIIELRELQFDYSDIVDSISGLKTSLTPFIASSRYNNCGNEIETAVDGDDMIIEDDDHGSSSVFFNEYLDRWTEAVVHHDDIEREKKKVAKFDNCIEKIYDQVKKARDETLREQISNREKLKKMQSLRAPESGVVAKNTNLFFKLCDTMESQSECINDDELGLKIATRVEKKQEEDQEQELEDIESRKSRREKLEENFLQIENRKANFIEKNKELASCAMGTLAITDEEKKRLNELLEDIDVQECRSTPALTDQETATSFSTLVSTPYTIDKEADELLKELTERLSIINSETYRKSAREEQEEEGKNLREEFLPHKEQIVLNSLRNLAESGSKEIYPISEEEVRQLIREYHAEQEANEFSKDSNSDSNLSSTMSKTPTIAQKVIRGLIKEAKATMPLFKFKYQTEELRDEVENERKSA